MHTNEGAKGGGHGTCGLGGGRMVIEAIAGWDGWPDAAGPGGASAGDVRRDADGVVRSPRLLSTNRAGDVRSSSTIIIFDKKGETAIKKGEKHITDTMSLV